MNSLINIAAILAFAFLVFAVVMVGLRLLIPSEPYRRSNTGRSKASTARRALADLVGVLGVLALVMLTVEIRFAYGAPFGERDPLTVEAVEVGDCERAPLGFNIARSCELTAYRYTTPGRDPAVWSESIEVVSGEPVKPGDRIARYSSSGWTAFAFLASAGDRWQPVSSEDHPNLVWLPTATLIVATMLGGAIRRRRTAPAPAALT